MAARGQERPLACRAALAVAALALAGAALLAGWVASCHIAADADPDPQGALAVRDAPDGFPAVDWAYWQGVNPDVIGWITIPGTTVDYPIVQAPADDPTYYLRHDVYRSFSYVGTPYLDAGCAADGLMSANAAIFAHHITFGEPMFAPVAGYADRAFAEGHARILIQTPDSKRELDVMAAARIKGADPTKRTSFAGREDFRAWYAERMGEAQMVIDADAPVRTTTLITCSYTTWENERTVVYAADAADMPAQPEPCSADDSGIPGICS